MTGRQFLCPAVTLTSVSQMCRHCLFVCMSVVQDLNKPLSDGSLRFRGSIRRKSGHHIVYSEDLTGAAASRLLIEFGMCFFISVNMSLSRLEISKRHNKNHMLVFS